jgi:hypothetical protein
MANAKITELNELATTPDNADVIAIVDDPAGIAETKKITIANLLGSAYPNNGTALIDSNGNETIAFSATAAAVNEITVTNAATGSGPKVSATGGDVNIPLTLAAKGNGLINLGDDPDFSILEIDTANNVVNITASSNNPGGTDLVLNSGGDGNIEAYATGNMYLNVASGSLDLEATGNEVAIYGDTFNLSQVDTGIRLGNTKPFIDANGNELLSTTLAASAVNNLNIQNAATGTGPVIAAEGTDTNIDLNIQPKGTGRIVPSADTFMADEIGVVFGSVDDNRIFWSEATHFGSMVWNSAAQAVLAMTGGLELYGNTQADGNGDWSPLIQWGTNGDLTLDATNSSTSNVLTLAGETVTITGTTVTVNGSPVGTYVNDGSALLDSNGNETIAFSGTASAVNEITVTNAATGSGPVISATGSDTNIPLRLQGKGNQGVVIDAGSGATSYINTTSTGSNAALYVQTKGNGNITLDPGGSGRIFLEDDTVINGSFQSGFASVFLKNGGGATALDVDANGAVVNYLFLKASLTGSGPVVQAEGSDTNIDLNLQTKGSGLFNFYNPNNASLLYADGAGADVSMELADKGNGGIYIYNNGTGEMDLTSGAILYLRAASGSYVYIDKAALTGMQTAGPGDGTTTFTWINGNKHQFTFGAQNETFTFTDPAFSGSFQLILIQDVVGGRTVTWPANVKWSNGGTAPTLSTAGGAIDIVSFLYDQADDVYYGSIALDFQ